jgi:DNA-binding transcriptional LysR family regulator
VAPVGSQGRQAPIGGSQDRGNLTTNDGEIAVNWALDGTRHPDARRMGHRALPDERSVVQVLPQYHTPDADIYAVYPQRHQLATRVRAFVDFISESFARFGGQAGRE